MAPTSLSPLQQAAPAPAAIAGYGAHAGQADPAGTPPVLTPAPHAAVPEAAPAHVVPPRPGLRDRLARRVLLAALGRLRHGRLTVVEPAGTHSFGTADGAAPGGTLHAVVTVHHPGVWRSVLRGGTVGAGEAYMRGWWEADDLTAVVRIFVANRHLMDALDNAVTGALSAAANRVLHALRRNTRAGSRRNIAAHYDLGNAFFATFLDARMMYSAAIYPRPDAKLDEASTFKLERICDKLRLGPEDHLLEIGTGWGGLAEYAATTRGCRVTTTTISREQYEAARARIRNAGLADRVTVLHSDYRDLTGRFDKLVSVEMIEAVGHRYVPEFFRQCRRRLKPGGLMLLQAITIDDRLHTRAKRSVDFIQRYIFPGGCLPSVSVLQGAVARHTDLRALHLEDIGPHYARTLADWRRRFLAHQGRIRAMGYDETFLRMWAFYLAYCEGGFLERSIGTVQLLLGGPENRSPAWLPGTA